MCTQCCWPFTIDTILSTDRAPRQENGELYVGRFTYGPQEKRATEDIISRLRTESVVGGGVRALTIDGRRIERNHFLDGLRICQECGRWEIVEAGSTRYSLVSERDQGGPNKYMCIECSTATRTCGHCHERPGQHIVLVSDDPAMITGPIHERWCAACAINRSASCDECGTRTAGTLLVSTGDGNLCPACARQPRRHCAVCEQRLPRGRGLTVPGDSENLYCGRCYRSIGANERGELHDHGYSPRPKLEGPQDSLFIGFELEIDRGEAMEETIQHLSAMDVAKDFYMKADGSLDNGIEIVSHPKTVEQWAAYKPKLAAMFDYATSRKWKSHNCPTCGLHFHVSRKGIAKLSTTSRVYMGRDSGMVDNSEASIMRMIYLYEKYRGKFIKFARRTRDAAEQWASSWSEEIESYHGEEHTDIAVLSNKKVQDIIKDSAACGSRYKAVNLCPRNTIEFRLNRGTLKLDTFMASMYMIDNLVKLCCEYDNERIQTVSFEDIVHYKEYDELTTYATERGLIVCA